MQSHADVATPNPLLELIKAIGEGNAKAYEQFAEQFSDSEHYQALADYLFNTPNALETCEINALSQLATHIESLYIDPPANYLAETAIHLILKTSAKRGNAESCLTVAKIAYENFQYSEAELYLKMAQDLKFNNVYDALLELYTAQGRFAEAKTLLTNLLIQYPEPKPPISSTTAIRQQEALVLRFRESVATRLTYINHLAAIQASKKSFTPVYPTLHCVIYFDFDDILVKANSSHDGYYLLSQEKQTACKENLSSFITGTPQGWTELFTALQSRGFIIGLCTARNAEYGKDELYQYFIGQFGQLFSKEHILFAGSVSKPLVILDNCKKHEINPGNVLLVDDQVGNINECAAHNIKSIHAKTLAYKSSNFIVFTQYLLERAQAILDNRVVCKSKRLAANRHSLYRKNCGKDQLKTTPAAKQTKPQCPHAPPEPMPNSLKQ